MQIVPPSVEIISATPNAEQLIELAGRTCYKSEDRITEDSAGPFIERIKGRKHDSVLEHASMTARFICDRGVTHEMVRHRLASFSQESTRYCNYGKEKFGRQIAVIDLATGFKMDLSNEKDEAIYAVWLLAMGDAERHYLKMLDLGASPQMARSVLPNSLKTEIVMTANMREWRHVFTLRTSEAAHPQIDEVMTQLLDQCVARWPAIFGDLRGA